MTGVPEGDPVRPWLAIALAGPPGQSRLAGSAAGVTVIDIAGQHTPPVMVNPLEPGAGYPVQAHADHLAGLLEAAFGLSEPVAAAVRAGLHAGYADCGWDLRTGRAGPGAPAAPAVPGFAQLRRAIVAATTELGYSEAMRAKVAGFLASRLDPLWGGSAGRFLEGGHPADLSRLLCAGVVVVNGAVADDQAVAFLAGALLLRVAELARPGRLPGLTVVLESPSGLAARPGWFGQVLSALRAAGAEILVPGNAASPPGFPPPRTAEPGFRDNAAAARPGPFVPAGHGPAGNGAAQAAVLQPTDPASPGLSSAPVPASPALPASRGLAARSAPRMAAGPGGPPALAGRRSAACGQRCQHRPCTGYELHAAALLAGQENQAWPRLWAQVLVIAFVTGRPVPRVPYPLRRAWAGLSPRRRECVLADVIERAVTTRSAGLRPSYDPRSLMSTAAALAARMLDSEEPVLFRAGQVWVIPPLRWLHEMERVHPLGHDTVRPDDIAPPLDFGLAGLPDWPGIRVKDRISGLRQHPMSMESQQNRQLAATALLGEEGGASLYADLATAGTGFGSQLRLRHAARMMGTGGHGREPGWLEVVLSWPQRIIRPAWESDVRQTATG